MQSAIAPNLPTNTETSISILAFCSYLSYKRENSAAVFDLCHTTRCCRHGLKPIGATERAPLPRTAVKSTKQPIHSNVARCTALNSKLSSTSVLRSACGSGSTISSTDLKRYWWCSVAWRESSSNTVYINSVWVNKDIFQLSQILIAFYTKHLWMFVGPNTSLCHYRRSIRISHASHKNTLHKRDPQCSTLKGRT